MKTNARQDLNQLLMVLGCNRESKEEEKKWSCNMICRNERILPGAAAGTPAISAAKQY